MSATPSPVETGGDQVVVQNNPVVSQCVDASAPPKAISFIPCGTGVIKIQIGHSPTLFMPGEEPCGITEHALVILLDGAPSRPLADSPATGSEPILPSTPSGSVG